MKKILVLCFVISMFLPILHAEGNCQKLFDDCMLLGAEPTLCHIFYEECMANTYGG